MPNFSPMVRAALMVSDLDRSRAFYKEILELDDVFVEGEVKDGNMPEVLAVPDTTVTRICVLKRPGYPEFGMVGLFELTNPQPQAVARPATGMNRGELCMVFYCDDLDPVTEKLKAGGHVIVSPAMPLRLRGYVKQREMIFRDPDGALINLIEWDISRDDRPETWQGIPEDG
jgi:catechol 2,3-dioxygenase-like lactoylglutathione lyase family enzyme